MSLRSLPEQLLMRIADTRQIDGLWVGAIGDKDEADVIAKVEEALALIKLYDPVRYRRVQRHLKRIFICLLFGPQGSFVPDGKRCDLDIRYVRKAAPEFIASTIVHEATHAHPCMIKIGYREDIRHRVEAVCMRQQLAFAGKLPDGQAVRADVEARLEYYGDPSVWSKDAMWQRRLDAEQATLKAAGIPDWISKPLVAFRNARLRLWRVLRRFIGGAGL